MADRFPLPTLLSQALVAFTIELDNEFEHQMPHRTSSYGSTGPRGGPWLVSMVMWFNCMRFVSEKPMPVAELERRARTPTNLDGMRRWGYVVLEPADPADRRPKPPRSGLTDPGDAPGCPAAREVWRPLPGVIEDRWRERLRCRRDRPAPGVAVGAGRAGRGRAARLPPDPGLRALQQAERTYPRRYPGRRSRPGIGGCRCLCCWPASCSASPSGSSSSPGCRWRCVPTCVRVLDDTGRARSGTCRC